MSWSPVGGCPEPAIVGVNGLFGCLIAAVSRDYAMFMASVKKLDRGGVPGE